MSDPLVAVIEDVAARADVEYEIRRNGQPVAFLVSAQRYNELCAPSADGNIRADIVGNRAYNALMRAGITTVAAVQETSDDHLLALPKFGITSLKATRRAYGRLVYEAGR